MDGFDIKGIFPAVVTPTSTFQFDEFLQAIHETNQNLIRC